MTAPNRHEVLEVAVAAARAGGAVLLEHFGAPGEVEVRTKSTATDPVSDADVAAEAAIRAVIADRRPHDGILGEEGDDVHGTTGLRWVVDPLDGTVNFLFGIPQWCVSVACDDVAGAILDPVRAELFTVVTGGPGQLDGRALRPRRHGELATALVATGFAYDAAVRERQADVVGRLLGRVRDVRRLGSAALDLAWTAAGRYDAYYERGVKPWDVAAGTLLCRQVGLEVHALPAADGLPAGVLAAPPALAGPLLDLVG
ncbi:MAG: inositol monophosphatase family protein [Microvirga sp.]